MNGDPAHLSVDKVRLDYSLKKLFSVSVSFSIILTYGLHSDKHVPYILTYWENFSLGFGHLFSKRKHKSTG